MYKFWGNSNSREYGMRFKYAEVPRYRGLTLESDLVVRKTWIYSNEDYVMEIGKLVNYFIANPSPLVVPVYDWQFLGRVDHGYKYSYSMMRMGVISGKEKQIINAAGDHPRDFLLDPFVVCANDSCEGQVSDYPTLVGFLQEVIKQDRYHDLHSGNVMMDVGENYRLIDLEGFVSSNIKDGYNAWFQ